MLTQFLARRPGFLTVFATVVAFCTYACMYAFRKAYQAADFSESPEMWDLTYKSVLVIVQVIGYALSKFIGIKVVSEMSPTRRAWTLIGLLGMAGLALLGFALVPAPYNWPFLFFNGLPLGMVWGLVFSYLEGRKQTEVMGLGLCASFIFASGLVKDVGRWLMGQGVDEFWMPVAVAGIFLLPLLISVFLLNQLPAPSAEDIALRTARVPMTGKSRMAFFRKFAPGLILLIVVYTILTAYRDFRDTFMAEFWTELRGAGNEVAFSQTEIPVSISVLLLLMLLVLVKDNRKALAINHLAVGMGLFIAGFSTWAFSQGWISDLWWLGLTGFGTYMAYIPFNSILFDRLIATVKQASNVGFLIYVADSFGYLGSVMVLLYKNLAAPELSWVAFFFQAGYLLAVVGVVGTALSGIYFWRKGA
ncbi:MAG: DUF5690 family protein [Bacteroidia bacterium]|nr:DUF5690 family protein [Bacteroidia bacterium]